MERDATMSKFRGTGVLEKHGYIKKYRNTYLMAANISVIDNLWRYYGYNKK